MSLPMIHGVALNELFPHYAIANLQYRYEALFFLYPHAEICFALVDRPRFTADGESNSPLIRYPQWGWCPVLRGGPKSS